MIRIFAVAHFRCWHETDLPRCPQFRRYRGESGHGGFERRLPSLTDAVEKSLAIIGFAIGERFRPIPSRALPADR